MPILSPRDVKKLQKKRELERRLLGVADGSDVSSSKSPLSGGQGGDGGSSRNINSSNSISNNSSTRRNNNNSNQDDTSSVSSSSSSSSSLQSNGDGGDGKNNSSNESGKVRKVELLNKSPSSKNKGISSMLKIVTPKRSPRRMEFGVGKSNLPSWAEKRDGGGGGQGNIGEEKPHEDKEEDGKKDTSDDGEKKEPQQKQQPKAKPATSKVPSQPPLWDTETKRKFETKVNWNQKPDSSSLAPSSSPPEAPTTSATSTKAISQPSKLAARPPSPTPHPPTKTSSQPFHPSVPTPALPSQSSPQTSKAINPVGRDGDDDDNDDDDQQGILRGVLVFRVDDDNKSKPRNQYLPSMSATKKSNLTCLAKYDFDSPPSSKGKTGQDLMDSIIEVIQKSRKMTSNEGVDTVKELDDFKRDVVDIGSHLVHADDKHGIVVVSVISKSYTTSAASSMLNELYEDFVQKHNRDEIKRAPKNSFSFQDKAMMHEVCIRFRDPFKIRPRRQGVVVTKKAGVSSAESLSFVNSRPTSTELSPRRMKSMPKKVPEQEISESSAVTSSPKHSKEPEWLIAKNSLRSESIEKSSQSVKPTSEEVLQPNLADDSTPKHSKKAEWLIAKNSLRSESIEKSSQSVKPTPEEALPPNSANDSTPKHSKEPEWLIAKNSLRSVSSGRVSPKSSKKKQAAGDIQSGSIRSVSFHDSNEGGAEQPVQKSSAEKSIANPQTRQQGISLESTSNAVKENSKDKSSLTDIKLEESDDVERRSPQTVSEDIDTGEMAIAKSMVTPKRNNHEPEWMKKRNELKPASTHKRIIEKEKGIDTLAAAKGSLHSSEVVKESSSSPTKSPYQGLLKKAKAIGDDTMPYIDSLKTSQNQLTDEGEANDLAEGVRNLDLDEDVSMSRSTHSVRFEDNQANQKEIADDVALIDGDEVDTKRDDAAQEIIANETLSHSLNSSSGSMDGGTVVTSNTDFSWTRKPKFEEDADQERWLNPARPIDTQRLNSINADLNTLLSKRSEESRHSGQYDFTVPETDSLNHRGTMNVFAHRRERGSYRDGGWSLPSTATKEEIVYRKLVEKTSEKDYRYTYITARAPKNESTIVPGSYWEKIRERHFANEDIPVPTFTGTAYKMRTESDYSMTPTYKLHSIETEDDTWLPPNSLKAQSDVVRSIAMGAAAAALAEREMQADSSTVGGISIGALSEVSDWQPPVVTRSRRVDFAGGIIQSRALPSEVRKLKAMQAQDSDSSSSDGIPWVPVISNYVVAEEPADSSEDSENTDDDDESDDVSVVLTAAVEAAQRRNSPPPVPHYNCGAFAGDEELGLEQIRTSSVKRIAQSYTGRISFSLEPELIEFENHPGEARGSRYQGGRQNDMLKKERKLAKAQIGKQRDIKAKTEESSYRWLCYVVVAATFITIPAVALVLTFVVSNSP